MPDRSFEAGIGIGEIGFIDYQYIGVRYNHRVNPDFMAFGDVGQFELSSGGSVDEITFGIGGYYMLQDMLETADTAVRFSYHNYGGDLDGNSLSFAAIVSGRNGLGSNPDLQWYGILSYNRLKLFDESDSELGFGFGLVHPTTTGEIYGGVEHIDELFFGFGYRHFL